MSTDDQTTPPVKVAEFIRYEEAQAAVDRLSDDGFPVNAVTIVWSRLRHVEHVVGRRTVATAALQGALSGLWFGSFLGLLLTLFVELDEGASALGVVISYALVGAAIGAIFQAFKHWSLKGRRDFSTLGRMDAESYEVWVEPDHVDQARGMLTRAGIPVVSESEVDTDI